jgi:alcohol dehydrogenase class IV
MSQLTTALPDSYRGAINWLNELQDELKVKRALSEVGINEEDVEKATKLVFNAEYSH